MRNKIIFSVVMFLVVVSMFGGVNAIMLSSDAGVKYDSKVVEALLTSKWAPVIVDIKDVTNISVSYKDSKEVRAIKDAERKRIFNNITDSVLSTLSEDEFKSESEFVFGYTFFGNITKEGFDKLLDNSDVKVIFFSGTAYLASISRAKNIFKIIVLPVLVVVVIFYLVNRKKHK